MLNGQEYATKHMRWFITSCCLVCILQVVFVNGLNSYIVKDDTKSLLVYKVEKYYDNLEHNHYLLEKMKVKYDQMHNNVSRCI